MPNRTPHILNPPTINGFTTEDILAALEAADPKPSPLPPGWITAAQYAQRIDLSERAARRRLDRWVSSGAWESRTHHMKDALSRSTYVTIFRPLPSPTPKAGARKVRSNT